MNGFKFNRNLLPLVLDGRKTQTRRCDDEPRCEVGDIVPIMGEGGEVHGHVRVTEIRRERLQEISEEDCSAEGIVVLPWMGWDRPVYGQARVPGCGSLFVDTAFSFLWDSLAKPGKRWEDNPEVVVYGFERRG